MESRDAQDAGAVRRSGAFSGRQVPLEMGTLRVGGSGRPVPAVFSAAASRRSVTSSLDAAAASIAISPRLTLEAHLRSPFRRREELSKTVVRSRDDSSRSRFQVKNVTGPHPLSARSPQIRRTGKRTMESDVATRSHDTRKPRSSEVVVAHDGQSQQLEQNGEQTQQREEEVSEVVRTGREELAFQVGERLSDVDATPRRESPTHFEEDKPHSNERRTSEPRSRALPLPASSTLGTFVSSTPSLTKLRSSFTARELALFTHRQDNADSDAKSQARYHVASHPHSTTVATPPAALETNQERSREKPSGHKHTVSSVTSRRDPEHIPVASGKRNVESPWTRVDTSIDHIYEDPAIDMVQMHLLHSHHTTSGQKKRKMVERERVLSAASGLREQQIEMKRQQEQIQQRKLQVQKMSEAIRQQNQRAVRARAVHSAGVNGRRPKPSQRSDSAPNFPERKPPVPRLSRNGTTPKQLKRKKKPKDDSRLQGVSASILMGLPSNSSRDLSRQELATDGEGEGAKEEEEDDSVIHDEASNPPAKQQTAKRRPPASTPRVSKREKRSIKPPENDAAIRSKEERRAIAREYMQLQKNSRRIWNAKVKEQSQREQEKRQQQLEVLEATRLKKLRLAKKRANNRKKQELVDPVLPEDDAMVTIAMSISPRSSLTPYDNDIDTPSKRENMQKVRRGDEEISFDEPHLDDENDRAIGNRNVSERRSTHFDASPFRSAEQVKNVEVERDEKRVAQASERVQKLLELREKAAALSARLSGLRKQQGASTEVLATEPESKSGPSTNDVARSASDIHGSKTPTDIPAANAVNQPDLSTIHVATSSTRDVLGSETLPDNPAANAMDRYGASESGSDNGIGEDAEGDRNTGNESGDEFDDRRSGSSDVVREGHDVMESRNGSSVSEENDDSLDGSHEDQISEAAASPVASSQQIVQQTRAFNAASATLDEDIDIDIRSIGVYNIGVVWPLNTEETTEAKSEAKLSSAPVQADSSSSSSSGSSSTTNSPRGLQRLLLAGQLEESHDESRDDSEGAFEVAFYEQLKGRLQRPTIESKAAPSLSYREERGEDAMSASESDSDVPYPPARTWQSGLSPVNGTSPVLMNQSRQPNEGLMRLIRETDDSLSVVDRAAKALYRQQVERLEREKEKELQIRIEAEKKALLEKDLALKAVMESLTGKIASDDDSGVGDSDDGGGSHSEDDAADVQDAQYKRLEEIMDEVERERARENGDNRTSCPDRGVTLDERQTTTQSSEENLRERGGIPVSTSSSIFWDQLVSDSAPRELDGERLNVVRPHVAVDDSELVAQREARLREEDERKAGYDSPPRVHSPRTLSKMLMAAVDYQEAIFEAHMQLAMMEHAHELETVQAETITLAQAFKEEMENNATTHQLALNHAILEKKFDDDTQDVMQQLTTIREAEEQERVAHESQLEQQLRQANLRECSVQTEASQRADAATSAALHVDTSTSPIRFKSDAAVQASPPVKSERGCGGAVEDDVAASEYSEESENDGGIDMAEVQLANGEEAIGENAQGEQYSSQFEDSSRGNSMSAIPTKSGAGEIPSDQEISEIVATSSNLNGKDDNAGIAAVSEELHYSDDAFESGQVEETKVSYSEHLQQSEIGDEGEDVIVDAHEASDGKADSENYEAEYENDYENASFDEAQPASEVYSEDAPASVDDYPEDEVAPSMGEEEEETIVEHEATEGKADSDNYEAEYENDYESASFDEAQSATGAPSEDASPPIEEYPDGEIAPSVGEEEEEDIIVDEHETSEGNAESGNYEDEYENDYENASFDEAQSATDVPSDDVRGSIEEYPEAEVAPSVGDEEEEIIAEHETSEGKVESDNYEAEYENDYESASFDEAQSTADVPSEDASRPVEEDAVAPTVDEEEEEAIVDEHQTSGGKAENIKDEAEYENDYEDASFDGAQSATDVPLGDVRDPVERHPGDDVVPSIDEEAAEFIDEKEDEVDTYEAGTENDYESESFEAQPTTDLPSEDAPPPDQALSDAGENPSEIGDDIVPSSIDEEEEGNVIDEQETSEDNARSEGDNYEEEYENDYENESFDEVQSTTDVPPDDAPGPLEEYSAEAGTVGEDALKNSGHGDEDEDTNAYSDEGFDSASGSFASEAPPPATASQSHVPGSPHGSNLAASTSVKEEELTQAIEVVAGQIQEDEPADELSIVQGDHTASVRCAAEDSKSMLTSVSISASHDGEEEVLAKSIEERMARLEALRQKIADRKGEILGVQKQMRVEKRREQVVAEEKLLWDEMEAVEKLLRADEAALALCRQRNRLEIMNLEARQLTHAARTENGVGNERPIDLLSGFDYVEEACVDEVQKRSLRETMMARSRAVRGFDLLEGYVYIEDVEPVKCHTDEHILPAPAPSIAEPDGVEEMLSGVNSDSTGSDDADSGSENGDQGQAQDMAESEDSMLEGVVSDLLNGYNYVEDADPVDRDTNVSASPAAVPSVEAPDDEYEGKGESGSEANTVAVASDAAGNGPEFCDPSQDVALNEDSVREQTLLDLLDDCNYVEDVEPVDCDVDEPIVSTAVPRKTEFDCESEATCGDAEPDEQVVEPSVEESSNGPPEATPREDNEHDRAAESERMTDEVFASIFDDIINSELQIWSRCRLAHSTSSREESVTISTAIATVKLRNSVEPVKQVADEATKERALNPTQELEERLETVNDELRFPALPDDLIPQDAVTEPSELPVIREQSERELEQQVQLLPDEASAEDLRGDVLVSQNCSTSNVGNIVSEVQSELHDVAVSERFGREQVPIDLLEEYNYVEDAEPADCDVDEPMVSIAVPRKTEPDDEVTILYEDAEADEQTILPIAEELPSASPEATPGGDNELDSAAESERMTDEIFASIFDDTINSELRIWSRRRLAASSQRSPQRSVTSTNASTTTTTARVGNSPKTKKRVADEASKGRDLNATQQLVERLEIVNGELRLPALQEITKASASPAARVLYDTVETLAQDCFNAIQQTATGEVPLDQTSVLQVIQQHVETEVRELLAIREQSERELERQVQLLSDETGAEGLNSDVLLSQNCIASNVSSIVSKVQSDLSRTTEDLSTAAQPSRSGIFSRTPVSRARSTSILSSLQTQQDQELQQRLTGLILSDLLHDAGLP